MTLEKLLELMQQHKVPKNAQLKSDSGWECSATDMDGIFYHSKLNIVCFTQGFSFDRNNYKRKDGWKTIYCGDIEVTEKNK